MTREEYNKQKEALKQEYQKSLRGLAARCALENNPYKIGDIIEDHIGKGKITGWYVTTWGDELPTMTYKCDNLTKKGEINKREPYRDIWQLNIKKQ